MIQVIKELKDRLFLLIIIQQAIIKFLLSLSKTSFFQEWKLKITTLKLIEELFMISQLMAQLTIRWSYKSINRARCWLHNWLFVGLQIFWRELQINCSWFKQTKSSRCWFKTNLTDYFYWYKNINSSKYKSNNLLHSRTIKRNRLTIL